METKASLASQPIQPEEYSAEELKKLKEFIETVQNDDARSALACWGDYSEYNHGY